MSASVSGTDQDHAHHDFVSDESIITLGEFDILLGRASGTQSYQGNNRYRALCHAAATWYHAARGNTNLKRSIVHKVIGDISPGRFIKREADGSLVEVTGKERYIKVQTDLRTGRVGRLMNKTLQVPEEHVDAAVSAQHVARVERSDIQRLGDGITVSSEAQQSNPANVVTRTVSSGEETPLLFVSSNQHDAALTKMRLEAEYHELMKEKEFLMMQNKILELKQDLKGLREYNRQLESSQPGQHVKE